MVPGASWAQVRNLPIFGRSGGRIWVRLGSQVGGQNLILMFKTFLSGPPEGSGRISRGCSKRTLT